MPCCSSRVAEQGCTIHVLGWLLRRCARGAVGSLNETPSQRVHLAANGRLGHSAAESFAPARVISCFCIERRAAANSRSRIPVRIEGQTVCSGLSSQRSKQPHWRRPNSVICPPAAVGSRGVQVPNVTATRTPPPFSVHRGAPSLSRIRDATDRPKPCRHKVMSRAALRLFIHRKGKL